MYLIFNFVSVALDETPDHDNLVLVMIYLFSDDVYNYEAK